MKFHTLIIRLEKRPWCGTSSAQYQATDLFNSDHSLESFVPSFVQYPARCKPQRAEDVQSNNEQGLQGTLILETLKNWNR